LGKKFSFSIQNVDQRMTVVESVLEVSAMTIAKGHYIRQSLPRKWIADMLHFSHRVPVVAAERILRVRATVEARKKTGLAVSWGAMMVKTMALVSQRLPEMRRAYLPYPWPRLYEAPYSVASVILDREYEGEHATLMAPVLHPEWLSLIGIDAKLKRLKTAPFDEIGSYRRLIRTTQFPLPIRRLLWSTGLYGSGLFRARNFGTFAVNSVAAFRARMLTMTTPITSCLYYGSISRDGEMAIQFAFDHRVFDGYQASRVVSEIERVLNNEIVTELKSIGEVGRAAA
jgi:hypothetical protein